VASDYRAQTVTVTFDDEKATIDDIKKALEKANFSVEGEPKYLK